MPKKYPTEILTKVWHMVHVLKMPRKLVAEQMLSTPETIDAVYQAAYKRFNDNKGTVYRAQEEDEEPTIKIVRPPAEYSNHSPYRIASPGTKTK